MESLCLGRIVFYIETRLKIPFTILGYGNIVCSPNLKPDTEFMGKIIEHIRIERFGKIYACPHSKDMFGIGDLLRIGNCYGTDNNYNYK